MRSRTILPALACLLACVFFGNAFVSAPRSDAALRGAQAMTFGAAAAAAPQMAMAENLDLDTTLLSDTNFQSVSEHFQHFL